MLKSYNSHMKKHVIVIALTALFTVLFISCEYEPKGVFNQPVDKDIAPPQIQVVELNLESDNIYLYTGMNVKFLFNTDNQKIKATRFLIDGIVKGIINSNKGEFYIWAADLAEGYHELVIEIYTESGTGSIADKIGAEAFVALKSWSLYMDKSFHPEVKAIPINGLLNITWTPYRATNFKEYVVYRHDDMWAEKEISRSLSNEYVDGTYVGEGGSYIIKVLTSDDSYFILGYLNLRPEIPKINFYSDSANLVKIKWSRGKYYNAVDSFVVFMGNSGYDYKRVNATNKISDTVYKTTAACFGDQLYFKLRVVPRKVNLKYVPREYSQFESWVYDKLGYKLRESPRFMEMTPVTNDEFIYISAHDSLVRYSVTQRKIVEKIGHKTPNYYCSEFLSLSVSPSGNYTTSRIGCNMDVLFTLSNNLNSYSPINPENLFGRSTSAIPVSDIGTGLFSDYNEHIYIYDFISSTVIGTYTSNFPFPLGLKISSNGDYFFEKGDSLRLVGFKNQLFKTIWKVSNSNSVLLYEFNPVNSNQVIFVNGNTLSVKQCDNLSTVNQITLTDKLLDIDYYKNEILTYKTGHLLVRSFTNGSLIKDIPINFIPVDFGDKKCFLINHTIITGDGLLYYF